MQNVNPTINFPIKTGLVSLSAVDILREIEKSLQIGSKRTQLSWADFTFKCNSNSAVTVSSTFEELVDAGVPYLDALTLKFADSVPNSVAITPRLAADDIVVNYLDISRGLFAWYFSLYSQGKSIGSGSNNFLRAVLNLGDNWSSLVTRLTTANIENFPKEWVKDVNMSGLDEASRNRLALGAAGQRFLQALNYLSDSDFLPDRDQEKRYVNGLKAWTSGKVYWDLHPLFKNGNVITVTKSLNKSIEDCLFHGLNPAAKTKLVNAKIIFQMPNEQPAHAQWRALNFEILPRLEQPIFVTNINL